AAGSAACALPRPSVSRILAKKLMVVPLLSDWISKHRKLRDDLPELGSSMSVGPYRPSFRPSRLARGWVFYSPDLSDGDTHEQIIRQNPTAERAWPGARRLAYRRRRAADPRLAPW